VAEEEAQTTKDKEEEEEVEKIEDEHEVGFMDDVDDIQPVNTLDVKDDQTFAVQSSWKMLKARGLDHVGVKLMKVIFELEPGVRSLYSFGHLPDIFESPELL